MVGERHAGSNMCSSAQDTLVRDPFFTTVPAFFNMSLKELFAAKHPTGERRAQTGKLPCPAREWRTGGLGDGETCLHSTHHWWFAAWGKFERGETAQEDLFQDFFIDGRPIDGPAMLRSMVGAQPSMHHGTSQVRGGPCAAEVTSLCWGLCRWMPMSG